MRKWLYLLLPLALASLVCSYGRPIAAPTQDVSAIVNATLTAVAKSQPLPVETALPPLPVATETPGVPPQSDLIPPLGVISGRLSYPSSGIPPLRVAAFDLQTGQVSYTDLVAGQNTYSLELPAGTYQVVAYLLPEGGLAGGYTQAVPCGLSVECIDHTLISVTVNVAATTKNVDPGDWYAPEGTFPPIPNP